MKIKQLRLMKGLSQAAFSNQLDIAQNTLSNYENGRRKPDPEIIKKIAATYGVTTDYLLDADQLTDSRLPRALKTERERHGLTVKALSEATKIPQDDLRDYESGSEPVNLYLFEILCKEFGKTPAEFYITYDMYTDSVPETIKEAIKKYKTADSSPDRTIEMPDAPPDSEIAEIAEMLRTNPDYGIMLNASKHLSKKDIRFITSIINRLKENTD